VAIDFFVQGTQDLEPGVGGGGGTLTLATLFSRPLKLQFQAAVRALINARDITLRDKKPLTSGNGQSIRQRPLDKVRKLYFFLLGPRAVGRLFGIMAMRTFGDAHCDVSWILA